MSTEVNLDYIPAQVESHMFEMNPATDDLVSGVDLRDGMIVLISEQIMREFIYDIPESSSSVVKASHDYSKLRARQTNRWCTVTKLEVRGEIVTFIGVYADGTKVPRKYNQDYFWYVKI